MNQLNRFACWGVSALLTLGSGLTHAQVLPKLDTVRSDSPQTERFALVVYTGSGVSFYSAPIQVADGLQQVRTRRMGVPATVRLMWHPDHRLRVGIESGWTPMYAYSAQADDRRSRVFVSAIPLLVVYSMPVTRRFALFGGTGAYLINSTLRYNGVVRANALSLGWMVAGHFTQPITRNLGVAVEVKWHDATQTNDANFALELQLVWRAYRWR
ncbi:hypothetical protein GCM10023189_20160 [Nibrella saemangeumensis]|uniref:Outer membrane protein beta-barrel domain-containing protein n=1 Tax=Nibrella saemangeumensis TaxID=1084526 RepID=A0ABP8MRD3_9BACT